MILKELVFPKENARTNNINKDNLYNLSFPTIDLLPGSKAETFLMERTNLLTGRRKSCNCIHIKQTDKDINQIIIIDSIAIGMIYVAFL